MTASVQERDLVVIGGGPAGLAAALAAKEDGIDDVLIIERSDELGGILNQCIHNGFGIHLFEKELTGPEYAERFIKDVMKEQIECLTGTVVTGLSREREITAVGQESGLLKIKAKAVVLAMGCRERTRSAIHIPGDRPAGVFTAGTIQQLINLDGYLPGKTVVILGSGDIGLIMARRLTLEGVKVQGVVEIMSYPGGLNRNIAQCLNDFGIPLYLSHTVVEIRGKERVEGVVVAPVDSRRVPILDRSFYVPCDTIVLSVGLIPENELSRMADVRLSSTTSGAYVDENLQTSVDGIFACGNVLHVHDVVDFVTRESWRAGKNAARFIKSGLPQCGIAVKPGKNVRYVVPHMVSGEQDVEFFLRVSRPMGRSVLSVQPGLREVRQRIVKPSEMISVTLSADVIAKAKSSGEIRFELDERGTGQ
ncbi:MAG: FAD/NAD(P)-binding oxidoreductase [Bacillota bacterium]